MLRLRYRLAGRGLARPLEVERRLVSLLPDRGLILHDHTQPGQLIIRLAAEE